jgi:hypothetical protein
MIYFKLNSYDQKTLTDFAFSHHRDRDTAGSNRLFVRIFSHSRIEQHGDSKFNSHSNVFCKGNLTGWLNRLDHVDGSRYSVDRCTARIIQALNVDEIIYLTPTLSY